MSKHSYLKIYRPCDIDIEQVLFKKRISIGEGIYEYPISYLNKPLIIQTPIIYIPYSTYRIDNKITFDFFFSNLSSEKEVSDLYELIKGLDKKVIYKISCKPKIKSGRKRQKKSPKRDFIIMLISLLRIFGLRIVDNSETIYKILNDNSFSKVGRLIAIKMKASSPTKK